MTSSSAEKRASSTSGSSAGPLRTQDARSRAIHSHHPVPDRQHSHISKAKTLASMSADSKSFHNYQANKEATDVPNPVPDTGPRHNDQQKILTSSTSKTTSPASTGFGVPETSHYLSAATATVTNDSYSSAALEGQSPSQLETSQVWREGPARSYSAEQTVPAMPPAGTSIHLPTIAAVFLTIAAGAILIGLFVVVRLARRSRRVNLTSSLPASESISYFEKDEPDGSPIFGGKERASLSIHGSNSAIWTWTQYQSGIPKPAPALTVASLSSDETHCLAREKSKVEMGSLSSVEGDVLNYVPAQGDPSSDEPFCSQPAPNAVARAVSRLSTVSASLYPNSRRNSGMVTNIGVALEGTSPLTGDDHWSIKRSRDKKTSQSRNSMLSPNVSNFSTNMRRSQSFAYGGVYLDSPVLPPNSNATRPGSGRARIRSTYFASGPYPRISAACPPSRDTQVVAPLASPYAAYSEADLRTLTSASGLKSPIPASSQPSLDSNSMIAISEPKTRSVSGRSLKKPVPKAVIDDATLPVRSSGAIALGSLMMNDFTDSTSFGSLIHTRASEAARDVKVIEERAPRVPSPPPIPSLAQMGMCNADPQAYADYHSPTYSIYGLYNGDRRSRIASRIESGTQ